jgi:hypothetical protein
MLHAVGTLTASFGTHKCQCVASHSPIPLTTEGHHVLPQEWQKELRGSVFDQRLIWLCGTTHNNIHVYLNLLRDGKPLPATARGYTRQMAEEGYRRYIAAGGVAA